MRRLRAGIAGLGRIASLYEEDALARRYYPALTHAGSYCLHPRIELASGCDPDPARRASFGRRWGVRAMYSDLDTMLRAERLDILSVCTHPEAHLGLIRTASGRVPLIFCEKPMGRDLEEARRIVDLCRRGGSRLAVNLYRLFDPSHLEAGRLLKKGLIGPIQRVNCFYGKGLRNQGTHLVSLLRMLFGEIEAVRTLELGSLGDIAEASADFVARMSAGFTATFQACDFRAYRIFEVDILGRDGRMVIDREGLSFRLYRSRAHRAESGARELVQVGAPVRSTVGRALYFAVDNLARTLDRRATLLSPGEGYLAVEKTLDAVRESARRHGRWVEVG